MGATGTLFLVLKYLPLFLTAVNDVEQIVSGVKAGSAKKDAALDLVHKGLDAAAEQGALAGDHVGAIKDAAPDIIDGVVGLLNGLGVFKKTPAAVQS